MIPLVVIRPEPGCQATATAAREQGLEAHGFPLFAVRPVSWHIPETGTFDAVLIGSANALRHAGRAVAGLRCLPAYAVGEATAIACREAGLDVIGIGTGGMQEMLSQLDPAHRHLLRLAGAARVHLNPPRGVTIAERIVYASEPLEMPEAVMDLLRKPCIIALHSAEAARHFDGQCEAKRMDRSRLSLATIGPRVAEAAGQGWQALRHAETPSDAALLALAGKMCKNAG